ncbi:MAG: hypothetical protein ACLPYB_13470 [Desulfobaccales bacterium]
MISQEKREQAENRARFFHSRQKDLDAKAKREILVGPLLILTIEYTLGRRLAARLRRRGEEGWEQYLQRAEISQEEAEEYMCMAVAVAGYASQPQEEKSH